MHIILIPGLWLDASSWDDILPALEAARHTPAPLTMPGVGASGDESAGIGIAEWVDAVVAEIDARDEPVVLVGHSGGGNVAWGAADARPDRVARVVFVDTVPPASGFGIAEFEAVDGVVPFPGWDVFDEQEISDLDDDVRARWAARAKPVPAKVPSDPLTLGDDRRFGVPVTILSGGMTAESLPETLRQWEPFSAEYESIQDAEVVTLGSGHWPQFSQPGQLGQAIVAAIR